jgi:hypothetical protein
MSKGEKAGLPFIGIRWPIDSSFSKAALHHCEMICSFFLILKVSNLGSIAKND